MCQCDWKNWLRRWWRWSIFQVSIAHKEMLSKLILWDLTCNWTTNILFIKDQKRLVREKQTYESMHNTYESIHVCWRQNMCRCKVFRIDAYCNVNKPFSVWCVWVDLKHECVDLNYLWVDTKSLWSMHTVMQTNLSLFDVYESTSNTNESTSNTNESIQVIMYRCIS